MRTIALLVAVALAPLLTSCQTSGGNVTSSQNYDPPKAPARIVTTPSPFHPSGSLVSARYVPRDHYYGFGGGYRPTYAAAGGADSADDNNFLYDSGRHCWYHRHSYCGTTSCGYGPSYGRYASNYCSTPYYPSGGYYYPGRRW